MKHIVLVVSLLILTSSLFAIEIEGQSFYSKVLQKEIKYGIVLPDN